MVGGPRVEDGLDLEEGLGMKVAHRHFWMRNRHRALASSLNNTDSD